LTSVRLIVLTALLTAGALGATIVFWGRRRHVTRPAGVLLTEALLVATVGLIVNRSQQFYPTWSALFATAGPGPASYHTTAGRLDRWLAAQPEAGQTQSFPWRPSGWSGWHLAGAPTVTVPIGYLAHPAWRYSAVLVIGARAWPVPPIAGPTVLVSLTTTAATAASTLAVAVPGLLGRDLRVTGHRWALVTSAADSALARRVVAVARGRFPAVAFVGASAPAQPLVVHRAARARTPAVGGSGALAPSRDTTHPEHGVGGSRSLGYDNSAAPVHSPATPVHSSSPPVPSPTTGPLPSGILTAYFPPTKKADPFAAALTWAAAETPPPLAASAPEPTYLPPAPKRPHHPRPKTNAPRNPHGTGQPRP
jgi:hypothetical protein